MSQTREFTAFRNINRLAIPAILAGIAEPLISLADTAFIGRVGTSELAAVGIASSFYLMMIWVLSQSLTAISAIVSRHHGADQLQKIKSLIPQALLANIALGLLVYFVSSPFSIEIFSLYKAQGEVLIHSASYYEIRALGFPFTLATMLLFGTFRGYQNTVWAMRISISGALLNLALDYVLIFGIGEFISPLGIEGAAWASFASQVLMFGLAVYTLARYTPFDFKLNLKLNPAYKWLVGMSFDLLIRTVLLNLTFYLAIRFATGYGPEVIAAHTIAINIWLFSSFFIDGYAHAGNAISGTLLGAKDYDRIFFLGKRIGKISFWIGTGLALLYLCSYPIMAEIFTSDPAVILEFNAIFWLVCISQPINAIAFAFDGIYKGLGKTKFLRNLLVAATLLGFIPALVVCESVHPNLLGIWIAFTVWMIVRSAWLLFDFKKVYTPKLPEISRDV